MKTSVLLLVVTLLTPALAHADEASRRAKAEHMIELTHADRMIRQSMDSMSAEMTKLAVEQAQEQGMTAEQSALFTEYMQRIHQITEEAMGWDKIKPLIIQVYVDNFTDEELDAINKFYESPAGQSMIAKMPKVMPDLMGRIMMRIKDVQPKIQAEAKAYSEKIKAAAPAKAPGK